jgi:hypothetical protein
MYSKRTSRPKSVADGEYQPTPAIATQAQKMAAGDSPGSQSQYDIYC